MNHRLGPGWTEDLAREFAGVQPLSKATGAILTVRPKYKKPLQPNTEVMPLISPKKGPRARTGQDRVWYHRRKQIDYMK